MISKKKNKQLVIKLNKKIINTLTICTYSSALGWWRIICIMRPGGYKGWWIVKAIVLSAGCVLAERAESRSYESK